MPTTGRPRWASSTVRWNFSGDHWLCRGTTVIVVIRSSPTVKAPPRLSTMWLHSTDAASPAAAMFAPLRHTVIRASSSGVSFSTDRRCIGDPPVR